MVPIERSLGISISNHAQKKNQLWNYEIMLYSNQSFKNMLCESLLVIRFKSDIITFVENGR